MPTMTPQQQLSLMLSPSGSRGYAPTLRDALDGRAATRALQDNAYDHLMDGQTFLERLGIDFKLPVSWQEGAAVAGVVVCLAAAVWLSRPRKQERGRA